MEFVHLDALHLQRKRVDVHDHTHSRTSFVWLLYGHTEWEAANTRCNMIVYLSEGQKQHTNAVTAINLFSHPQCAYTTSVSISNAYVTHALRTQPIHILLYVRVCGISEHSEHGR